MPLFGWAFCDGQLLAIAQNDALFSLIGTTYGGDGQQTFALPDLRSRLPVHQTNLQSQTSYLIGQKSGAEAIALTVNNIPNHTHGISVSSSPAISSVPGATRYPAATSGVDLYAGTVTNPVTMNASAVSATGGNQPFPLIMPYQVLNFIISLFGIFPSRN